MSQPTTFLSLGCLTKRTRADRFLDEMSRVVPWAALAEIVAPHYRSSGRGRPLTEVALLSEATILRPFLSAPAVARRPGHTGSRRGGFILCDFCGPGRSHALGRREIRTTAPRPQPSGDGSDPAASQSMEL